MGYIELKKELATGNRAIDLHHKHLVETFNSLLGTFRRGHSRAEIQAALDKLVDYATYHFNAEELWFTDLRFPEAAEHATEHQEFISRLSEIQKDFVENRPGLSLSLLTFLSRWLKTHLHGSDLKVAKFARQHPVNSKAA